MNLKNRFKDVSNKKLLGSLGVCVYKRPMLTDLSKSLERSYLILPLLSTRGQVSAFCHLVNGLTRPMYTQTHTDLISTETCNM